MSDEYEHLTGHTIRPRLVHPETGIEPKPGTILPDGGDFARSDDLAICNYCGRIITGTKEIGWYHVPTEEELENHQHGR